MGRQERAEAMMRHVPLGEPRYRRLVMAVSFVPACRWLQAKGRVIFFTVSRKMLAHKASFILDDEVDEEDVIW